ncbi:MAG: tRNA uridine-5-carboxymethylaminomethyl(34) synthesis GTPase MnmE [Deltaproteobacteria bacterium]|nr:tRNA uridine-5-carboxymethylaminomethyl(34) synthesis GTPase MnmE [Deltaproteobacteria bacterium]
MPNSLDIKDTITAVATPFGIAGIGIIRISGDDAVKIAQKIFKPQKPVQQFESHHLYLGEIRDPVSGQMFDQVLLSYMKAPHSYTKEDVVEINAHSGHLLLQKTVQIILHEGARLAKPGEFTYRAFINGRIDLTQAEAVVDLVRSKSEKGLTIASRQITGALRERIEQLRKKVIDILAHVEAAIDFPEEESGILSKEGTTSLLEREIIKPIAHIIASYTGRRLWMDGIHTVIAGRVNVGKSSLLNRLLNEQRAIVTPIPGTTRDVIESFVDLEGIPLRLMDTAGIRNVKGQVEKMGVQLSEQKLSEADLALIVFDQSRPLNQDDFRILSKTNKEKSLIIINKIDLPEKLDKERLNEMIRDLPRARISALTGEGIENLFQIIRDVILIGDEAILSSPIAPNLRQHGALMEATRFFQNAANSMREDAPLEIIAVDLHGGLEALGTITGDTGDEEIYDKIFSEFCLGK